MKKAIYKFLFQKVWGWTIVDTYPQEAKQSIVMVLHHTSNWDFPIGIFLRTLVDANIGFVAKDSLFKIPIFGSYMRWMGGYSVDRSKRTDFVQAVANIFKSVPIFKLCFAVEGTREKVKSLKTGFYYVAHKAGVPIVPCKFDWGKKQVGFGQPFYTTGDYEKDLKQLLQYFVGAKGKNTENDFDIEAVLNGSN
jgi:1-acyl-sn-glycerol-3-phosphate acyltransferase